jgi:hypothetical protein
MKHKGQFFLNNQDFFNAAWKWLVVDNKPKCVNQYNRCRYRNEKGDTCVIGAFIPDELYSKSLEGSLASTILTGKGELFFKLNEWFRNVNPNLAGAIQRVHDAEFYTPRKERMEEIGELYNLKIPNE